MRLKTVNIRNVRSIAEQTVQLTHNCCILVGINESGKSNILRAMALMSPDAPITPQDRRLPRPEDPPATESHVQFNFEFDAADRLKIKAAAGDKILGDLEVTPIFQSDGAGISVNAHIDSIEGGKYFVNIIKKTRSSKYYDLPEKYQIASNWVRATDVCPADYMHPVEGDVSP